MRSLLLNLSIKKRLILSFSVLLLLTFCLSMTQLWSSNTQSAVVDNMYKHPLTVTRASGLAYSSVLKIDASVKELLYIQKSGFGNDDEAKKAINLAEKQIAEHLSVVGDRILGDEGKKIHKAAAVQFELFVKYVNVITTGKTFTLDEYKEYTKEQIILERQLLAIVEYAKVKADGFYDASKVEMETAIYRTVISLLMVIALGIGIAVVVYRSILKPILLFKSTIEHVEEHSDLGRRLNFEAGCEIGEMARSFDRMMETIQQSIRFGLDASTTIEASNQKVSAQTLSIANSIENQSIEVGKVAMSVSELTQTIQHVAQNAADTLAKANEANEFADKGDGVIKELASDVSGLSTSAKATTDLVNQLQDDVSNIDSILDVICGIADQTNLLALNAAIEAARAGEQGRGFAVVADEVRTLAVRTTKSTSEIQATIERLQLGTKQVVLSIEQNTSLIQEGVNKADNASIQVNLIRETINEISDMNAQMAQETQNQAQMSQEIDESVQTISTLSKEASDNANDIAKQNADLLTQSRNLHSAMTQFRLSSL